MDGYNIIFGGGIGFIVNIFTTPGTSHLIVDISLPYESNQAVMHLWRATILYRGRNIPCVGLLTPAYFREVRLAVLCVRRSGYKNVPCWGLLNAIIFLSDKNLVKPLCRWFPDRNLRRANDLKIQHWVYNISFEGTGWHGFGKRRGYGHHQSYTNAKIQ